MTNLSLPPVGFRCRVFLGKLVDMVEFLIPHYIKEGKSNLIISIGCTGGKHRSVTLANARVAAAGFLIAFHQHLLRSLQKKDFVFIAFFLHFRKHLKQIIEQLSAANVYAGKSRI